MRSERELMEECNQFFGGDLEVFLNNLGLRVEQNLEDNNLLTAKYYQADIRTVKNIISRRQIR